MELGNSKGMQSFRVVAVAAFSAWIEAADPD
jgi:hypothetical protein